MQCTVLPGQTQDQGLLPSVASASVYSAGRKIFAQCFPTSHFPFPVRAVRRSPWAYLLLEIQAMLDTLSLQALSAGSSTPHQTPVCAALERVLLRHCFSCLWQVAGTGEAASMHSASMWSSPASFT